VNIAEHYNYFRDYDPGIGRYVQSDPIGLGGGTSTYAYVTSDPLGHSDPRGLWRISGTAGGILAFGEWGGQSDTGIAFDSSGNICVVVNNCKNAMTIGFFGGLGGTIGIEKGVYCKGSSKFTSHQAQLDLGVGQVGGIGVSTDGGRRVEGIGKLFGGAGGGIGFTKLTCETRTYCRNLLPFQ
jgi:hypothetical protein